MNGDYGIEFLDMFYDDCVKHRELRNENNRRYRNVRIKRMMMLLIVVAIYVVAFISVGLNANRIANPAPIIVGVTMGGMVLIVIFNWIITRGVINGYYENQVPDNINYGYLDEYLSLTGKGNIRQGRPHCLTGPSKKSNINIVTAISGVAAFVLLYVVALIISYVKLNGRWEEIGMSLVPYLFVAVGGTLLVCTIVKNTVMAIRCKEPANAVCVEVSRRRSSSSHGGRMVEMPVYYARCANGHAYVLYDGMYTNVNTGKEVGMIIPIMVNPKNPIEWVYTKLSGIVLGIAIFSCIFMAAGFMAYFTMLTK